MAAYLPVITNRRSAALMPIPIYHVDNPQVARRAYLDAVNDKTGTFFYVRRFISTVDGPDEFTPVTIRLAGNGAVCHFR